MLGIHWFDKLAMNVGALVLFAVAWFAFWGGIYVAARFIAARVWGCRGSVDPRDPPV